MNVEEALPLKMVPVARFVVPPLESVATKTTFPEMAVGMVAAVDSTAAETVNVWPKER